MDHPSLHAHLLELLEGLDGVWQDPRHHPERDALYHSLQVFEVARGESDDPELWAAALLHDVGKAVDPPTHAEVGAADLEDWLTSRVVWLVRHHMDLVHHPGRTRRRLRNTPQLLALTRLRRWDLAGRSPHAVVMYPEDAVALLLDALHHATPARDSIAEKFNEEVS